VSCGLHPYLLKLTTTTVDASHWQRLGFSSSATTTPQLAKTTGGNEVTARVTIPRPFELETQYATHATGNEEDLTGSFCKS